MATPPASDLPWRPSYLRRRVVLSFSLLFAGLLVAFELLLAFSVRNDGIGNGHQGQSYLWKYGPTAILTLVAALWGRVEHQSKFAAPWVRLLRQPSRPEQTVFVDYLSDLQPLAIVNAIRNKDFAVSVASTTAIFVKVLILLSTGLMTVSRIPVTKDAYPMLIQDTFVPDKLQLSQVGNLAYYINIGLAAGNISYPDGVTADYAFQSARPDGNFTDDALFAFTADAVENWMECQPAVVKMTFAAPEEPRYPHGLNFTVTSPGCSIESFATRPPVCTSRSNCTVQFARFALVRCDGTEAEDGQRILVMAGNLTFVPDYSRNLTDYTGNTNRAEWNSSVLHHSTQLLCEPRYAVTTVDVVRNGTRVLSASPSQGAPNSTYADISAWDILAAHQSSLNTDLFQDTTAFNQLSVNVSGKPLNVDRDMQTALIGQRLLDIPLTSLFDPQILEGAATGYYRQSAALIMKQALAKPTSLEILGRVVVEEERVVVQGVTAHIMAGLAAACLVFATSLLKWNSRRGFLPCSPSPVHGLARIMASSHQLASKLRYSGATDSKTLGDRFQASLLHSHIQDAPHVSQRRFVISETRHEEGSKGAHGPHRPQVGSLNGYPIILRPAIRAALILILAGIIVALELMLRKSNLEIGLGDAGRQDTYLHYTWTIIPAFIFGVISMAISAMDFQIRCLEPFAKLKHSSVTTKTFMAMDLLDASIPRILLRELSIRSVGSLAATTAFLIASLFTTFTASLFHTTEVPASGSLVLRANQSFSEFLFDNDGGPSAGATLILNSNASYPPFTHEHLAFLEVTPSQLSMPAGTLTNTSAVSIDAVLPAVRAKLDCRLYDKSRITTNLSMGYEELGVVNPLGIWIEGEDCGRHPDHEFAQNHHDAFLTTYSNMSYFGTAKNGRSRKSYPAVRGCSDLLYVWGKPDFSANPIVQHISAFGCNVSYEAIDVATTFTSLDLSELSQQSPPRPIESTVRISTGIQATNLSETMSDSNSQFFVYGKLAEPYTGYPTDLLDNFFSTLTTSRWAVPRSSLGDPSQDAVVAEAIRFQHGIIAAQLLAGNRKPAELSSATLADPAPGQNEGGLQFTATVTSASGRRRVMQDEVSTRVLQGLVGAVLMLLIAGWAFSRSVKYGGLLGGKSPTALATRMALLAGGNVLDLMPDGGEWMGEADVRRVLGGRRFWLGWGEGEDGGEEKGSGNADRERRGRYGIFCGGGNTNGEAGEGSDRKGSQ